MIVYQSVDRRSFFQEMHALNVREINWSFASDVRVRKGRACGSIRCRFQLNGFDYLRRGEEKKGKE